MHNRHALPLIGVLLFTSCNTGRTSRSDDKDRDAAPMHFMDDTGPQASNGPFVFRYVGTSGFQSVEADLSPNYEGWYAIRDKATGVHVAYGLVAGADTFEISTSAVLEKGHDYEFGLSLYGNRYCNPPTNSKNVWFEAISNVEGDITLERAFSPNFDARGCEVIDVKSDMPPGRYTFTSPGVKIDLVIGPSGFAYAEQMGFSCVHPRMTSCHRVGAGSNCSYPVAIAEDGSIEVHAGGNDTSGHATFVPNGVDFDVEGAVTECCDEPFSGAAARVDPPPAYCE